MHSTFTFTLENEVRIPTKIPLIITQLHVRLKNSTTQTTKNLNILALVLLLAQSHQTLYPCSAGSSGRGRDAWLSPSVPISHSSPCSWQSSWQESPSTAGHSTPRYHPRIRGLRGTPVAQEPTLLQCLKTDRARDRVSESTQTTGFLRLIYWHTKNIIPQSQSQL